MMLGQLRRVGFWVSSAAAGVDEIYGLELMKTVCVLIEQEKSLCHLVHADVAQRRNTVKSMGNLYCFHRRSWLEEA